MTDEGNNDNNNSMETNKKVKIPKNNLLTSKSQELRRKMTKEEKHIWYDYLKLLPINVKRQYVIDKYIVDFYIPQNNLVIEIDGKIHLYKSSDKQKDEYLKKLNLTILRITNDEINNIFDDVCNKINMLINNQ